MAKPPWVLQDLWKYELSWIGIGGGAADALFAEPGEGVVGVNQSDWGGVVEESVWLTLYKSHAPHASRKPRIGAYLGAGEALRVVKALSRHLSRR